MPLTEALLCLIFGGTLMIFGGEILVRGAVKLSALFAIPSLVVGLTVVAVCTSAPELAVSLTGILGGEAAGADIALGNVVGSNIYNILFILGLTAYCFPLTVSSSLIKKEIPLLIAVSILTLILSLFIRKDGDTIQAFFPQWGGVLFIALLLIYFVWTVRTALVNKEQNVAQEYDEQFNKSTQNGKFQAAALAIFFLAAGLALLVYGSNRCVAGAVAIAHFFKISELTISLTVLAAGTSLPELVVSLVAAARGRTDIAVGNVIGSNLFNLLGIFGLSAILVPGGLPVSRQALTFDIPLMVAVSVISGLFCVSGLRLCRKEGFCLLVGYIGYVNALLTTFNK